MGSTASNRPSDVTWRVLQTAPNREPYVCRQLTTHGLEPYAPQFPRRSRTRPGSVRDRRIRWVFPGYVFFRPPDTPDLWHTVQWAPGVRRILTEGGVPAPIADSVIRHLRRRTAEIDREHGESGFKHGERVVIEQGPLAALDAVFDRDLDAPTRVQILVHVMQRTLPVRIDPIHLRSLAS